ncbi:MAG: hypothetical protein Q8L60_10635 [Gammaproteobacteria bacterium]|nr:hypothetical protein [Gammaproteobacteria bacterium]MDP2346804.1 hypothetical protein [Gammaproteobacteria bacterium]
MNRLQLVQELCRLAGITDTGGPTTTIGQTGDIRKAVAYIDIAHNEIQLEYFDWNFLWGTNTITTSAGTAAYQGQSDLGIWDERRIYYDGRKLRVVAYQDYTPDADRENGPPEFVVIRPDNQLLLVPTPDDVYEISYDYFKRPRILTANDMEPLIPSDYRMVIVGRALMIYANFESAEEAKVQGQELYQIHMDALKAHEAPRRAQLQGRAENSPIVVIPE